MPAGKKGFQRGNGYGGRKKGAANKTTRKMREAVNTLVMDKVDDHAGAVWDKIFEMALDGHWSALNLVAALTTPKDLPVNLPELAWKNPNKALLEAVAGGRVTPEQGAKVATIVKAVVTEEEILKIKARLREMKRN